VEDTQDEGVVIVSPLWSCFRSRLNMIIDHDSAIKKLQLYHRSEISKYNEVLATLMTNI